jgi:L-rhamnose mutarotase
MTELVGLHIRLKPAMEKPRSEVSPKLVAAQREVGISRRRMFCDGLELLLEVDREDFERATSALARHPVNRCWQREMAPFVVAGPDHLGAAAERLHPVYVG